MLQKLILPLLLTLSAVSAAADNHSPMMLPISSAATSSAQDINLGRDSYRGVVATAHLKPLPLTSDESVSSAPDNPRSWLLSVSFMEEKRQAPLQKGAVAVKITSPDGKIAAPIRLDPVDGAFRAEVRLSNEGESLVKIGSKLDDGKKRIYRFFYLPAR